jgi:GNAT superfamily N-acetyltransferase
MPRVDPVIIRPWLCTESEIATFCHLVRQGEEVQRQGLEARIRRAKALVLLHVDRQVVGVAALKQPAKTYRDGVFRKAGVANAAVSFDLELGWVFVLPAHRGKQYSRILSAAALSRSERKPTFATTRADNIAMQRTLEHLAFRRLGDSWRSDRGQRPRLLLYVTTWQSTAGVRHASGRAARALHTGDLR